MPSGTVRVTKIITVSIPIHYFTEHSNKFNKAIKINESHDDQKGIKSSADNMIVFIENPKEITKKAIRNK